MNSKSSSHRQSVINSLYERFSKSGKPVSNRQLSHWAYAIFAVGAFVVVLVGILHAGYIGLPERTPLPSPTLLIARHYPTPTPLPTWNEPAAFVSTSVLRIFDSFGASGNYVTQLRHGDRVQILARSADGMWTQIRTWDGNVGWARTDRLVMASASHAPVPTVQAQMPPDVLFRDDFQDPGSGLGSKVGETGERYYHNGEYVIRVSRYNWSWYPSYPQSFMDLEIEVDARPVIGENLEYGLIFRSLNDGRYVFRISPNGSYSLYKVVGDQWMWLTYDLQDAVYQGYQTNRLRVKADGPQISLYVNDQFLETVTDTVFQGGQVGLIVSHSDYQDQSKVVEVHFDNLEIRSLAQAVALTPTPRSVLPLDSTPVARDKCQFMHVVEIPDTIYSIAARYGVSREELAAANNARSWLDLVGPGNLLCVPSSTSFTADPTIDPTPIPGSGCRFMHVVRPGDHPYYIRMRYGVSEEALESANVVESGHYFRVGRTLCIP